MKNRVTSHINAGSMADIAFLMLIFFIISATMDVDRGIQRKLPPSDHPDVIQSKKRNTFIILINRNNELFLQNEKMNISELRSAVKKFIENPGNEEYLPEKTATEVDHIGKVFITTEHIISLQNDRGTSYSAYIAVQNELVAAYNELRNELSLKYFKTEYADLDEKRKESIEEVYPIRISESNPVNIIADK